MPSPDQNSGDLAINLFGGRVTQFDPQSLPKGASPYNEDVVYSGVDPAGVPIVGGVATRPGMTAFYGDPIAGNPTINYLKGFEDSQGIKHLLSLDSVGGMRNESPCPNPPGIPTLIGTVVAASYAQSDSLVGREYIAISDTSHPAFGIDIPMQYDGINFDRVSQCGPGAPPVGEASGNVPFVQTIVAAPAGLVPLIPAITYISCAERWVTIKFAVDFTTAIAGDLWVVAGNPGGYDGTYIYHKRINNSTYLIEATGPLALAASAGGTATTNLVAVGMSASLCGATYPTKVGMILVIAAATDATYDGNYEIRGGGAGQVLTVYNPGMSGVASGGGTATLLGHVAAGLHLVSVCFVTRSLYITAPAPFGFFRAVGGEVAAISSIPIGPANVIARILLFSKVVPAVAPDNFYYLGVDVPAGDLASPPLQQHLIFPTTIIPDNTTFSGLFDFTDAVLAAGTDATYLFKLVELGECAFCCTYASRTFWSGERNKLQNLVNTSFDGGFDIFTSRPLGWNYDPSVVGSGGGGQESTIVVWGDAYKITGDGVNAIRGLLSQTTYKDFLGNAILSPKVAYSYRVRLRKSAGAVQGNFVIESPHTVVTIPVANMSSLVYTEFIGVFMGSQSAIVLTDLMKIYSSGTLTNGESIYVENIEIFPTLQPYNRNVVRCSYANDPESIDSVSGLLIPGDASTESVRGLFKLLDNKLYIVTDTGLYATQDDGRNEPYQWALVTVSSTVGMESVHGLDTAESWGVLAHADGLYIFWGSEVVKVSQEIQPDWDTINWQFGSKMYVLIDTIHKRIHVGAPTGNSTICNKEFVMDYSQLATDNGTATAAAIASSPQASYYGGDEVSPGRARKWTIWNLSIACAAQVERSDGSTVLLRGNSTGTGKVYKQDTNATSDDGAAIRGRYQTYYFPQPGEGPTANRYTMKYLTGYVSGSGILSMTLFGQQSTRSSTLSNTALQSPDNWDFEKNVNFESERMSLYFETNAVGSWFHMTKLFPVIQPSIMTPVRGNQ